MSFSPFRVGHLAILFWAVAGWGSPPVNAAPLTGTPAETTVKATEPRPAVGPVLAEGSDSKLRAGQFAIIEDTKDWDRIWAAHRGSPARHEDPLRPRVDFSRHVVLMGIVESASGPLRWQVRQGADVQWIDLEPRSATDPSLSDRSADDPLSTLNRFLFLRLPRGDRPWGVRMKSRKDGTWQRVATTESDTDPTGDSTKPEAGDRSDEPWVMAPDRLNVVFVHDPGKGNYDGAIGQPHDLWNLVSLGTTAKDFMRYSDTRASPFRIRVSRHDGAWGISGQQGVYHGYIYDNCRCKDLVVTLLDVPQGRYRGLVYCHGDAPLQNAAVELIVGGESRATKATSKKDEYRSGDFEEGVQYVRFDFDVGAGQDVKFIAHRDGSDYSMFNAIQIARLQRVDSSE